MRIGALEAGGTKMVCAVGDESGQILDRVTFATTTPEETCPKMIEYFQKQEIEALGIGCFGPIDLDRESATYGSITTTPKLAWQNFNIVQAFANALQVPIGFDTDVNAACLGEASYGCCQGVDSCMYITIGTGIGTGIMAEGRLLHGMLHPEAGHILIGRPASDTAFVCKCPFHTSCFEGLAAGPAIQMRYGRPAAELYEDKQVWDLESFYIAEALVNYIMILSPKRIVIGGGVMHQPDLIGLVREQTTRLLAGYLKTRELENMDTYIVTPSLNDNQGIMGCIRLALDAMEA